MRREPGAGSDRTHTLGEAAGEQQTGRYADGQHDQRVHPGTLGRVLQVPLHILHLTSTAARVTSSYWLKLGPHWAY